MLYTEKCTERNLIFYARCVSLEKAGEIHHNRAAKKKGRSYE
jgi:hypothetical protein